MKKIGSILLLASMFLWLRSLDAQDVSEDASAPPVAGSADGAEAAPPASDDAFVPSEEVEADEELTFPVDI